MNECIYCKHFCKKECRESDCYHISGEKPYFELDCIYKSKLTCKGKVYYNIHHFNKFQKLLAKIIWRIKIEDVGRSDTKQWIER